MSGISPALLDQFAAIVGERNALRPPADLTHYEQENRNIFTGRTPLVLKPGSTAEVSRIVRLAFETGTVLVPQGGHTGHAAGGAPDDSNLQIVVAMERMNAIRDLDLAGNTLTVDAGVVLQTIQQLADDHDRLFPLALGSQGSCQIGGNISSNAGGTGVLAYGNTRELVLGLEVVLPNGDIWDGLRRLKKDNTGYALKHLFIGGEGTLGIVTGAVLKLFAKPKGREIAFAAVASPQAALELLALAQAAAGTGLTAFELIHRTPLDFVLRNMPGNRDPLANRHEWYVMAEISSGRSAEDARSLTEAIFTQAMEGGLADDVAVTHTEAQFRAMWKLRDDMGPSQGPEGGSIKHDISVPVHAMPAFLARATPLVEQMSPGARVCCFGHMGDGNLHYNVSQPTGGDKAAFLSQRHAINDAVNAIVLELGGSISAEHGIGRIKRDAMAATKSPVELAMMKAIKAALDPKGIMNPGKLL